MNLYRSPFFGVKKLKRGHFKEYYISAEVVGVYLQVINLKFDSPKSKLEFDYITSAVTFRCHKVSFVEHFETLSLKFYIQNKEGSNKS